MSSRVIARSYTEQRTFGDGSTMSTVIPVQLDGEVRRPLLRGWSHALAAVGAAALTEPCLLAAGETAIALPAITGGTEEKQRLAFAAQTEPLSQHHFVRSRHGCSQGCAT